jgi:hypothetical protein
MIASKRKFVLATVSAGLFLYAPMRLTAFGENASKPLVNTDADKVAIKGYDPVAYFTDGRAAKGSPEYEYMWLGARWRFASAAHRDLFTRRPDYYAPRFGGYCAGAMMNGVTFKANPEAWVIVDGKLYLNGTLEGLADWQTDATANINKADEQWKALGQ